MDFAELIAACMDAKPELREYKDIAVRGGNERMASRVRALAKPGTEWKNFLDPPTYITISRGLAVPYKTALHASSNSIAKHLGMPELAIDDSRGTYADLLPPGTELLQQSDLAWLLPLHQRAIDNRRQENEVSALRAEVDQLRSENQALKGSKGRR